MTSPTIERLIDLKPYNINRIKLILEEVLDELNLTLTARIKREIKSFI